MERRTARLTNRWRARLRNLVLLCSCVTLIACSGGDGGTDGDSESSSTSGVVAGSDLGPLPDPSLTEPPSFDDEPIPEDADFHTATGLAVVREPKPFPEPTAITSLTEADFAAGLPDPVIESPPGVGPASNAAPYFDGLDNVSVNAGERLELRFVPRDPEGEIPGMFPQELPDGASFDDNFDGSKTLNWLPLQADIGITAVTVVAIDPAEPRYRSSQTVLIRVDAPDDPSTIPNVAPEIAEIEDYVVRVGDPVVVEIEGVDRNGTEPTLELPAPPAGATFFPRPFASGRYVLRFVPETVGDIAIEILARDADDPSLTGTGRIALDVRERDAFARAGDRLETLSAARGITVGAAISPFFYRQADGALYADIAADEYAMITHESSMKMDAINPLPGHYAFADADNLMNFARTNGMTVRGHPLVWYRQLPAWVLATPVTERQGHMREFIARIVERYADDVSVWDVVNEPLADDGSLRESIWYEAMGEDYIDIAFRQARDLDPDATLVLNEYDIGFEGPKFEGLLALLDRLIARDVPLDAVGFQLHLFASYDEFDELATNMAAVAARGLDVHVTELDVALTDDTDETEQAEVYRGVFDTCLAEPRCTTVQTWGYTDRYSFRTLLDPLPFDAEYRPKPAYDAMRDALAP